MMFSKKMMRLTLLSLLAQVIYLSVGDIPEYLVRPLLIMGVVLVVYCFHLYVTGSFTEEKLVEKIAEHRDEPLADLHAPDSNLLVKKDEKKEDIVAQPVTNS